MKVKELISKLQEIDQELPIEIGIKSAYFSNIHQKLIRTKQWSIDEIDVLDEEVFLRNAQNCGVDPSEGLVSIGNRHLLKKGRLFRFIGFITGPMIAEGSPFKSMVKDHLRGLDKKSIMFHDQFNGEIAILEKQN